MITRIREFRRMALTLAPLVGLMMAGGANALFK